MKVLKKKLLVGLIKCRYHKQKFNALGSLGIYLGALKNTEKVKAAVDEIVKFREAIPQQFRNQTDPYINETLQEHCNKERRSIESRCW